MWRKTTRIFQRKSERARERKVLGPRTPVCQTVDAQANNRQTHTHSESHALSLFFIEGLLLSLVSLSRIVELFFPRLRSLCYFYILFDAQLVSTFILRRTHPHACVIKESVNIRSDVRAFNLRRQKKNSISQRALTPLSPSLSTSQGGFCALFGYRASPIHPVPSNYIPEGILLRKLTTSASHNS